MRATGFLALLRNEPRTLGFGLIHTMASSVGQTFLIALFLPDIKVSFGLDDAAIATIYGFATVAGAGVLWWVGRWIDRVDLVYYSVGSAILVAAACTITAGATTVPLLAVGLFCLRLGGQGLLTHIAVTATARYFKHSRGKALSLTSMGHSIGEAALPATVVLLISMFGWRAAYLTAGAFALLAVLGAAALIRRDPRFRQPHHMPVASSSGGEHRTHVQRQTHFLSSKYFLITWPLFIATPLVMTALIFHQALIADDRGVTLQWFAVSFTAYAMSRVASSLLVGPAIDRYGADGLFAFHLLPLCAGIALLVSFSPTWAVPAYWILAGISSGVSGTLQAAIVAERVAPNRLGAVRSVLAAMMILGAAAGPAIYGWLLAANVAMAAVLWATAFAMFSATAVAAASQFRSAWSSPGGDS